MRKLLSVIGSCALLVAGATARADIVFDFSGAATGPVGTNFYAVTLGAFTLTGYGYNADNTPHNLYWKHNGGDENGLGLTGTRDNELTLQNNATQIANYIQIDVSQVFKISPTGQIRLGSTTNGEAYDLWGSNTQGSLGTKILNAGTSDNTFFNIPNWGQYAYIGVTVHPYPIPNTGGTTSPHAYDNVLMGAISVCPIPEPTSFVLAAFGIAGAGLLLRRRS